MKSNSLQEFGRNLSAALSDMVRGESSSPSIAYGSVDSPSELIVAFSGGLDSTVLLHALLSLNLPVTISAIHVNHGLSPNADDWEQHCREFCQHRQTDIKVKRYKVVDQGDGIEAAARAARYSAFEECVPPNACVLTAHHRDDQVETLLYRLMRGAGVSGLAGIPLLRKVGKSWVIRPLLMLSRDELETYANQQKLRRIEDESNSELRYDRNFIRHRVLPLFKERWPQAENKIAQTAALMAESDSLLARYAEQNLDGCALKKERIGESICLKTFGLLYLDQQKHTLRHWISHKAWPAPSQRQLEQILHILDAKADARPVVKLAAYEFRRYHDRLYLLPTLSDIDRLAVYQWPLSQDLSLDDGSVLSCEVKGVHKDTVLSVRYRQGGERCQPQDRQHSQSLKKLLQEYHLEPWLRDRAPLLYVDDELVAVADLFYCQQTSLNAANYAFQWSFKEQL